MLKFYYLYCLCIAVPKFALVNGPRQLIVFLLILNLLSELIDTISRASEIQIAVLFNSYILSHSSSTYLITSCNLSTMTLLPISRMISQFIFHMFFFAAATLVLSQPFIMPNPQLTSVHSAVRGSRRTEKQCREAPRR